jgi:hypothetical protein
MVATIGFLLPTLTASSASAVTGSGPEVDGGGEAVDAAPSRFEASGYHASVPIEFCEAIVAEAPRTGDTCARGTEQTNTTSTGGAFTGTVQVFRFVFVSSQQRTVDCVEEECAIAVFEPNDFAGTVAYSSHLLFSPFQADIMIKRRSDGQILGDNVYADNGAGETRFHRVDPGTTWTFALLVQNDGPATDDLTLQTNPQAAPPPGVNVHYFVSWFDVGALLIDEPFGFTFEDVAPGETRQVAVRFDVDPKAPAGLTVDPLVTVSSASGGFVDGVHVGIVIR